MLHLLKIDLRKLIDYRTFWIVTGLYFGTMIITTANGMEFIKWMASKGAEIFGANVDTNRIPLYHFPDIWQNLTFVCGFFKILLSIMVVISITNEFTYRTVRQNIIDGMSRWEFLFSKILTNFFLSLASVVVVFLVGIITGMIYSPEIIFKEVFSDMGFLLAYFLEVFTFLSYALMLGVLVQRSGLTIIILLISRLVELIIKFNIPDGADWLKNLFPMEAITNLVPMPFGRYVLQPIQDYVSLAAVAIAIGWIVIFNYLSYRRLTRSDI